MKAKQRNNINIKVEGRGDNLKLKAQSLKREFISRFQLLIIYINFMQKTNKKVGGGESSKFKIQSSKLQSKVQSRGLKLRTAGLMIFAMAAVWVVLPTSAAEAVFSCDTGLQVI